MTLLTNARPTLFFIPSPIESDGGDDDDDVPEDLSPDLVVGVDEVMKN